ncbi:unnamed protein product [Heligmosomoides polygyrus]|uniref:Uncharacterized protein n=1 Tax=Heligmosomoides polygyrus TaxID=6339 RepID=A0A183F6Q6_HELPZ|nr:unnamed protein product [Heligmosomoides polygyrus]
MSDISTPKKEWCRPASVPAAAARNGTKTLVVAPPRGDKAYERNRIDLNEALELAKSMAVLAKQNIVSYIPANESGMEPSHGPGARPRNSSTDKYSKEVLRDHFERLSEYLKGRLDLPLLEEKSSRSARTRRYSRKEQFRRLIDTILCSGTLANNRSPWQLNLKCILFRLKDNA